MYIHLNPDSLRANGRRSPPLEARKDTGRKWLPQQEHNQCIPRLLNLPLSRPPTGLTGGSIKMPRTSTLTLPEGTCPLSSFPSLWRVHASLTYLLPVLPDLPESE